MTRIGYDTDTQVYSYHDAQGKLYQGAQAIDTALFDLV